MHQCLWCLHGKKGRFVQGGKQEAEAQAADVACEGLSIKLHRYTQDRGFPPKYALSEYFQYLIFPIVIT
jgi:hypothetical protein